MDKLKKEWIIIGVCIVLVLFSFNQYAQKGKLKRKARKFQVNTDNLLISQHELKRQLEEANAKLAEQAKLIGPLQKRLDEANITIQTLNSDKRALVEEIERLQSKLTLPSEKP